MQKAARDLLEQLTETGTYVRRRRAGFGDIRYVFVDKENISREDVADSTLRTLAEQKYVQWDPQDRLWDTVHYYITDAGRAALQKHDDDDKALREAKRAARMPARSRGIED